MVVLYLKVNGLPDKITLVVSGSDRKKSQGVRQPIQKIGVNLIKCLYGFRVDIDPSVMPLRGLAQHHNAAISAMIF